MTPFIDKRFLWLNIYEGWCVSIGLFSCPTRIALNLLSLRKQKPFRHAIFKVKMEQRCRDITLRSGIYIIKFLQDGACSRQRRGTVPFPSSRS